MISANNKLLEHVSFLPELIRNRDVDIEDVVKQLEILKTKVQSYFQIVNLSINNLESQFNNKVHQFFDKIKDTKDMNIEQQRHLEDHIKTIPSLTKGVLGDVLKDIESQSKNMFMILKSMHSELDNLRSSMTSTQISLESVKTHTFDVHEKVNELEKQILVIYFVCASFPSLYLIRKSLHKNSTVHYNFLNFIILFPCYQMQMLNLTHQVKNKYNLYNNLI